MNTETYLYHSVLNKLREFFIERKFIEVLPQHRLSILAACEDPHTISMFEFAGQEWPLPQTGQMWLERELLENSDFQGVFCVSTSYRNEINPIPGRHDLIFPMFEFEAHGDINDLLKLEKELLVKLGFDTSNFNSSKSFTYDEVCDMYSVDEIGHNEEESLYKEFGEVAVVHSFPKRSHPFWNMYERKDGLFNKADIIVCGIETIGSAQRSSNSDGMRSNFYSVSGGKYAEKLFTLFGEQRVLDELEEYLSLDMFPRFGGGIGMTRLIKGINYLLQNDRYEDD